MTGKWAFVCAGLVVLLLTNRKLMPGGGLGRRGVMVTGGVAFIIGAVPQAAAQNIPMLVLGRICLGVGIGFANEVRPSLSTFDKTALHEPQTGAGMRAAVQQYNSAGAKAVSVSCELNLHGLLQ